MKDHDFTMADGERDEARRAALAIYDDPDASEHERLLAFFGLESSEALEANREAISDACARLYATESELEIARREIARLRAGIDAQASGLRRLSGAQ